MTARQPARWLSSPPAGLPDALLRGMLDYAEAGVPDAQRERLRCRLAQLPPAAAARPRWRTLWLGGAAALLLTAAGLAVIGTRPATGTSRRTAPMSTLATSAPPAPPPAFSQPLAADAAPASLPARAPAPQPRERSVRLRAAAPDAGAELQLLVRARRVLRAAPGRALELAQEHRQTFARGMFVQERELLAIEALRRLGRHDEADLRARAFRQRFPGSPHLDRVGGSGGGQ